MTRKKTYTEEFKVTLVNLLSQGKTIAEVSREYGVPTSNLVGWKKLYTNILTNAEEKIILSDYKKMKKEFESIKEECEILVSYQRTDSIRELAMLIKNCDLFLGNEGGPRHLTQALDVGSFTIFGPNAKKKYWLPKNNGRHEAIEPYDLVGENLVTKNKFETLSNVKKYGLMTPEIIMKKVRELLNINKKINKKL